MILAALMHLLLAAFGLAAIAGGIAAVSVPQFLPPRTAPRFRMAFVPMAVAS